MVLGHVRYGTAENKGRVNAQPMVVTLFKLNIGRSILYNKRKRYISLVFFVKCLQEPHTTRDQYKEKEGKHITPFQPV